MRYKLRKCAFMYIDLVVGSKMQMYAFVIAAVVLLSSVFCVPENKETPIKEDDAKAFECLELETTILSPYYFEEGLPECGDFIAEPINPYRQDLRLECQRWMDTPTVPSIVNNYLINYCERHSNGMTQWRATICCDGVTTEQRCFQCSNVTFDGDYACAYHNDLVTCPAGQVCRTQTIGYGEYPNQPYETLKSSFCADVADCPSSMNFFTCTDYVPNPQCNYCCEEPYCNLDTPDRFDLGVIYEPCGSNPCRNGGTCTSNNVTWTYTCQCAPGYSGDTCQISRCYAECKHAHFCFVSPYHCSCKLSYCGEDCDEVCGPCLSDPDYCNNGGTCYDHGIYGLRCACPITHVGERCEFSNGLTCSDPSVYYKSTSLPWVSMTTTDCTDKYHAETGDVKDISRMDKCKDHMQQTGKPEFENNVHGFVDQVEKASMWRCERGDEHGGYSEDACCPTCYSVPCEKNGWCTQTTDHDYVCKCRYGWEGRNCEIQSNVCLIDGDPHYVTFDGAALHFQGECKYLLSGSDESFPPWESYLVVGKNKRGPPPILQSVSYLESIEIHVFDHIVRLDQDKLVFVDDEPVQPEVNYPGFRILYNGANVRLETNFTLIVEFNGVWTGQVKLPPQYAGTNQGMCGNADGNRENDLMTKDGVDVSGEENRFSLVGESWKLFDPNKPNCTAEDTDVVIECPPVIDNIIRSDEYCGILNEPLGVFATCIADPNIINLIYFDNCVYDVCAYANDTALMKFAACSSISAFATICKNLGHVVDWRDEAECPFECPDGMEYEFSAPACYATCGNPNAPEECHLPNTEGCVCPDTIMVVDQEQGCINATTCGCVDDFGNKWKIGDSWLSSNCTIQYTCKLCLSCTRPVGEITHVTTEGCTGDEVCGAGPKPGTGECEVSDCPGCTCTDSMGYVWQLGESHLTNDCMLNMTCIKCAECEIPMAYLHKQDHQCPEGTTCVPNVNTGTCDSIRLKKLSGSWRRWSEWSECKKTSNSEWIQYRHRVCTLPGRCEGQHFEERPCHKP